MIKLKDLINEDRESDIQTFVDIISTNPDATSYQKYKKILKDKYGVDYDKEYGQNDENLISLASLDDIKKKSDFLNFRNYQKYADQIFSLRGLLTKQPNHIDKIIEFDKVEKLSDILKFRASIRNYTGKGNYAQVSSDKLEVPDPVDVNTLIHELGHVYHYKHYKDGLSSTITYASSPYGRDLTHEVFAENFMHYFIAPRWLKSNLVEVYNDLNKKINSKWKREITNLLK